MLLTRVVPFLLLVLLWLYCLFDAITADASRVRNLSKTAWVFVVLLLLDIGAIAWIVAGRPRGPARSVPNTGSTGVPPEYDRPGRAVATNPDDDAAFLENVRRRAEEQRRKAEEERRRAEEQRRRAEEQGREDEGDPPA